MSNPKVVIYTTARCPYCEWSKAMLQEKGAEYEEVRIDLDDQMRQEVVERTGRSSAPQIFIGDTHVGGYDDMVALDEKGELDALLKPTA